MAEKKAKKTTAVAKKQTPKEALTTLSKLNKTYSIEKLAQMDRFERMAAMGQGLTQIRAALEPLMPKIMPLAGNQLGFLMDKPYPAETIIECLAEAALRGVEPVNNEFNIISGKCYLTKAGLYRLVKQSPGLTDLKMNFKVPTAGEGKDMIVHCMATWKVNGVADSLETDISVTAFQQNRDAAIGKATRKLLARIYDRIAGGVFTTPEGEVGELELLDVTPEEGEQIVDVAVEEALAGATEQLEPAPDPRSPVRGPKPYQEQIEPSDSPEQGPPGILFDEPASLSTAEEILTGQSNQKLSADTVRQMIGLAEEKFGVTWSDQVKGWTRVHAHVESISELSVEQAKGLVAWLRA